MGSSTTTFGAFTPVTTLLPKQRRQLFQESPVTSLKLLPGLLFPPSAITHFRCRRIQITSGLKAGQSIRRSREFRSISEQETSPKDDLRRPSLDASTKTCVQCGQSKLLTDFEKMRPPLDERTEACRACLAVLRVRRSGGPLFHLGLSVEEAWEQAKTCTTCGVRKELRDFARERDSTIKSRCRSCMAKYKKLAKPPVDSPQKCTNCGKVKPAMDFYPSVNHPNGLQKLCKVCYREKSKAEYVRRRTSPVTLTLTEKVCRVCKQIKPAEEFYRSGLTCNGLQARCKTCCRTQKQRNRFFQN